VTTTILPPFSHEIVPTVLGAIPDDGMVDPQELMALLPNPSECESGTWVALLPHPNQPKPKGFFSNLFRKKAVPIHNASRCTALLAKGYVDVGAGYTPEGDEIAFGKVP
jgi:hypothetical protein